MGLKAEIIYIQEPFLGHQKILQSGFNFYWLSRIDNQKDMQILTVIRKDILNRVFIENCIDLVSHLYCFILDIKKLHFLLKKVLKKTEVVNLYDNKVGKKQLWEWPTTLVCRIIQNIPWTLVIRGQILNSGRYEYT